MPTPQELNIPDKLDSILATKQAIRESIVAKGVKVPEGTTFHRYADLISGISTGLSDDALALATATPKDVTAGKTFYAGDRTLKTGTAEKGFVLKQIISQSISGKSEITITINSKSFIIFGAPYASVGAITAIIIHYENSSVITSAGGFLNVGASITNNGYVVTLSNNNVYDLSFVATGTCPIYVFEG